MGLQQCARQLAHYLRHELHLRQEYDKRAYIEKYLPHIGIALQEILELTADERDFTVNKLDNVLHTSRTTRRSDPSKMPTPTRHTASRIKKRSHSLD